MPLPACAQGSQKWLAWILGSPNVDILWFFNFLGTFCCMKNLERINILQSFSWEIHQKNAIIPNNASKNQKFLHLNKDSNRAEKTKLETCMAYDFWSSESRKTQGFPHLV